MSRKALLLISVLVVLTSLIGIGIYQDSANLAVLRSIEYDYDEQSRKDALHYEMTLHYTRAPFGTLILKNSNFFEDIRSTADTTLSVLMIPVSYSYSVINREVSDCYKARFNEVIAAFDAYNSTAEHPISDDIIINTPGLHSFFKVKGDDVCAPNYFELNTALLQKVDGFMAQIDELRSGNDAGVERKMEETFAQIMNGYSSRSQQKVKDILASGRYSFETTAEHELKTMNFSIPYTTRNFSEPRYKAAVEAAISEVFSNNQLPTGAQPYSSCYRTQQVSIYNLSAVEITTGGHDVVALIKDLRGNVVNHAYIKAGDKHTLKVADGQYDVFFISGTGWNPYLPLGKNDCPNLKGGFMSNQNVIRNRTLELRQMIMTYDLTPRQYGNMSLDGVDMDDVF